MYVYVCALYVYCACFVLMSLTDIELFFPPLLPSSPPPLILPIFPHPSPPSPSSSKTTVKRTLLGLIGALVVYVGWLRLVVSEETALRHVSRIMRFIAMLFRYKVQNVEALPGEGKKQPINTFIMPFNTYKQPINTIRSRG